MPQEIQMQSMGVSTSRDLKIEKEENLVINESVLVVCNIPYVIMLPMLFENKFYVRMCLSMHPTR